MLGGERGCGWIARASEGAIVDGEDDTDTARELEEVWLDWDGDGETRRAGS